MEHIAMYKLSKTQPSLLPKVSDKLRCGNMDSAVFFYHSDHLGSASWITNGNGNPVQHLQYMPYGEPFVNERISLYNERFTFTGKERDSETGFSYFGARYYDSDLMTAWLSVDPMADKYPGLSPYAYCGWNPVRLVDPDGRMIGDYYNYAGKYLGSDNDNDNKVYVATRKNEDGTFENAQDLGVTHDDFCTISNIVKQESSHAKDEDLWIAHAANNAAQKSKKSLYEKLMSGYSSVKKGNKTPLGSSDDSPYANSARAAVIDVLIGGIDPTGGASLWDGTDFLAMGSSQAKFRQYTSITINVDIYNTYLNNNLAIYKSGTVRFNKKSYNLPAPVFSEPNNWINNTFQYTTGATKATNAIKATGAVGRSIFWKIYKP